jgi:hypothetical protein
MKKIFATSILTFGFIASFYAMAPKHVTIHAQSLPVTKQLCWDANSSSDAVTGYIAQLDSNTAVNVPAATLCTPVTFNTNGAHTLTVKAVNIWGTSAAATLNVDVKAPAAPANSRIQ